MNVNPCDAIVLGEKFSNYKRDFELAQDKQKFVLAWRFKYLEQYESCVLSFEWDKEGRYSTGIGLKQLVSRINAAPLDADGKRLKKKLVDDMQVTYGRLVKLLHEVEDYTKTGKFLELPGGATAEAGYSVIAKLCNDYK